MTDAFRPASVGWDDYVLGRDQHAGELLAAASAGRRLTVLLGDGFDPRTLHTLRCAIKHELAVRVVRVPLPKGPGYGVGSKLVAANRDELARLAATHEIDIVEADRWPSADRLTTGSRLARGLIAERIITADDVVVVDISALPSRIYFPLIGSLLELSKQPTSGELLVTVSENPEMDRRILNDGTAEAGTITGFSHGFNADVDPNKITLWSPVIGEGSGPELEAIYDLLQEPQEIYPILPFPASNPRRGDDLVQEHRSLLFDRFEVEPRNILYVHEANAFDTYRALTGLHHRAQDLLSMVGEVQLVVSAHASKMLSTGVCLAAWESRLPVVTATSNTFAIDEEPASDLVDGASTLCCLWLRGAPYR